MIGCKEDDGACISAFFHLFAALHIMVAVLFHSWSVPFWEFPWQKLGRLRDPRFAPLGIWVNTFCWCWLFSSEAFPNSLPIEISIGMRIGKQERNNISQSCLCCSEAPALYARPHHPLGHKSASCQVLAQSAGDVRKEGPVATASLRIRHCVNPGASGEEGEKTDCHRTIYLSKPFTSSYRKRFSSP